MTSIDELEEDGNSFESEDAEEDESSYYDEESDK
jgi:hypothetical protein